VAASDTVGSMVAVLTESSSSSSPVASLAPGRN
jgi:hypothetical protein